MDNDDELSRIDDGPSLVTALMVGIAAAITIALLILVVDSH